MPRIPCIKVSLDIPTGFLGSTDYSYFQANHVLSLAAAKRILRNFPDSTSVYIADIGIPKAVYDKFKIRFPNFAKYAIIEINT